MFFYYLNYSVTFMKIRKRQLSRQLFYIIVKRGFLNISAINILCRDSKERYSKFYLEAANKCKKLFTSFTFYVLIMNKF